MATSGQLSWDEVVFIAERVGVNVVKAPSSHRGKKGRMGSVVGITRHHTGTPNSYKPNDDYPDYNVVKEGRSGLRNSLSTYGIGRHTSIYVFSEFLSWHAGAWNWQGITDGNGHFLGIEAAGVGDWTAFQRQVYPRLCASALSYIGEGTGMMPRHLDGCVPRGRKTDAARLWPTFGEEVQFYIDNPKFIDVNYQATIDEVKRITAMTVLLTSASEEDGSINRAPAIHSGLGDFMGLGSAAEIENARRALPEVWVEPYTWDAYAAEKAIVLAGARAAVESAELLRRISQADEPYPVPGA